MSFIFNTSFKRSISEQEKYSDTFLPEMPDSQLKTENIGINKTSELAGWSSDMDMKELRSSMDFIRKTAGSFIDEMVENIQKLQKEKAAQKELAEDDLVFQIALLGEDTKKFYLVDKLI